jgi:hypothetical protein
VGVPSICSFASLRGRGSERPVSRAGGPILPGRYFTCPFIDLRGGRRHSVRRCRRARLDGWGAQRVRHFVGVPSICSFASLRGRVSECPVSRDGVAIYLSLYRSPRWPPPFGAPVPPRLPRWMGCTESQALCGGSRRPAFTEISWNGRCGGQPVLARDFQSCEHFRRKPAAAVRRFLLLPP